MAQKIDKVIPKTGQFILLLIGINILMTSVLLICHISVSPYHFPVSYVLTAVCFYILHRSAKDVFWLWGIVISTMVVIAAILLSTFINEIAYDGNLYHKFATGILSMGWNPIYGNIHEYVDSLGIPDSALSMTDIWATCYAKASWYFDSTVYALVGSVEAAKIFNFLVFAAVFGICFEYFRTKLKRGQAFAISLIFTGIPVSFAQLFTYYLDGALGQLLVASIILLLSLTENAETGENRTRLLYLAITVIICSNLKITGLAFEAFFCGGFFIYWCALARKDKSVSNNIKLIKRNFLKVIGYYTVVVFVSVGVVGAGTYLTNMRDYGNPFYPVLGSSELNFSNSLKSVGLEDASPIRQLLTMVFVRSSTDDSNPVLQWKVPFSFHTDEFLKCCQDNIRGGAGVFFSGILCVSIIMLIYMIIKLRKTRKKEIKSISLIILISFLLMCIMPAGGQVRYSPYIYFGPYFTIFLWMLYLNDYKVKSIVKRLIGYMMIAISIVNAFIFSEYIVRGIVESKDYSAKYSLIQESGGKVEISTPLPGIVFNFIDRDIEYRYNMEKELVDGEMAYLKLKYDYLYGEK